VHKIVLASLVSFYLTMAAGSALGQSDDVGRAFSQLSAQEIQDAKSALAVPLPVDALTSTLDAYFLSKEKAAQKLGDIEVLLAVYREWRLASPTTFNYSNFANELMRAGKSEEALSVRQESIAHEQRKSFSAFYMVNYANDLYALGRFEDVQQTLDKLKSYLNVVGRRNWSGQDLLYIKRAEAGGLRLQSEMDLRVGKFSRAVEEAAQALVLSREAFQLARALPIQRYDQAFLATQSMGDALRTQVSALKAVGRFSDAEVALSQFLQFAKEFKLQPRALGLLYDTAASLRFDLREFRQAESDYRSADKVYATLGYGADNRMRTGYARAIIAALEGQQRWDDVFAELNRIDALSGDGNGELRRNQFPLERGYAYLHSANNNAQALLLLQRLSTEIRKRYAPHQFQAAQADGLLALALWQSGAADNKRRALALLKEVVLDYMLPGNIDAETAGLGKDIRELIFSTYLEAVFATPGEDFVAALEPADWIRGGMVQEALADAAVRSAAMEPGLADLVRQDQDARNEIEALRHYLSGGVGSVGLASAETIARMHGRIATLDAQRSVSQQEIKKKFPGYDRLVHPHAPSVQDVSAALAADEALLMLLPTEQAVYVWAISNTGKQAAYRVALSQAQLTKLIQSTRATLDLGEMDGHLHPFNASASSALYQALLGPAQEVIDGRKHLIVAPGGLLGQIPFAVLLTKPSRQAGADAPWLIRQAAITQIPSLSAWLAVKKFARAASATEPLAGWADPSFANKSGALRRGNTGDAAAGFNYADIPSLPETRDELLAIAQALHAAPEHDLYLGEMATKASVMLSSSSGELQKKRVIVFATHGLVAGDLPNLNQPALALANTQSGGADPLADLLTLDDVLRLKLNADWVVLSACNTAASDGKGEEAMSGLARGFFYAGSRSLLVTYWSVDSESAKALTTATFSYQAANPNGRKAESLRQAMLKVMSEAQYAHPAYWAPYALVGDGG